jgi:hypothetical protein
MLNPMKLLIRTSTAPTSIPIASEISLVLYSVISKGIHELTEEECIKYYPVLKNSIESILHELNAAKKKIEIANQLQKDAAEIKGKKS